MVCGYVFAIGYREQSEDYWNKTNKNLSSLREKSNVLYQIAFYKQGIYRKPKTLEFCAEGFEKSLPNFFEVDAFTADLPKTKGQANFALPQFSSIDWILVISLILSFVAMIFTYDSICGEKETGTLRQMLANAIPRNRVLLGKYVGAMVTLAIPLVVGMLISLIVILPSKDIAINGNEWVKIIAIMLLSLLFLSNFVLLGMFVSSRTGYPANSMAILLLIWIAFVVLLPSFSLIIFNITYKDPADIELQRRLEEAGKQIWDNREKYGEKAGNASPDLSWSGNDPPARARLQNAMINAKNKVREDHHNKLLAQAFVCRNLSCISPVVIYQRAAETIAGTGINHCNHLYKQVNQYKTELKEFVRSKDLEDPDSLHLLFPEGHLVESWKAISNNPVDFASVPKFQERDLALGQSLKLAILDIGLLALFNLVFFAASFVSFLRYDVR
jgi:ABC-type transport system involved in multi-copper enzyme maturation permease subunit